MNDTERLEDLLRKTPRLKVPGALREKLRAGIVLPRAFAKEPLRHAWRPLVRRWLPVLSFSAFFLACVVAIAVQSNLLSDLRRENESLKAGSQNLEGLRQENLEYQKLRAENQQLEQLRKDNLELQKLRDEVTRLHVQLREIPSLRAENERLLTERKAAESRLPADAQREEDPFDAAQKKAQRIKCISNIKQIGLAARLWSNDHDDAPLPTDFVTMREELNSPKVLICPGDTKRSAVIQWSDFGPSNVSYEMISPGVSEREPAVVYVRCPIHNNVGLADGSAHMLGADAKLVENHGRWTIQRGN